MSEARCAFRERQPEQRHDLIVDALSEGAEADDEPSRQLALGGNLDVIDALGQKCAA
jgi:hypothetical protein